MCVACTLLHTGAYAQECVKKLVQRAVSCSRLQSLETGLSLDLTPQAVSKLGEPPALPPHATLVLGLQDYTGPELGSSRWRAKYFTYWAISPSQPFYLYAQSPADELFWKD